MFRDDCLLVPSRFTPEMIVYSRPGLHLGGDKHFYDGEEVEEDVSEANILVSEASKLSAGARIFRGP